MATRAQIQRFIKTANEEGFDISDLSEEELAALAEHLHALEAEEGGGDDVGEEEALEEEEKLSSAKLAEARMMGQAMGTAALNKLAAAARPARQEIPMSTRLDELDKLAEARAEELLYAAQSGVVVTHEKLAAATGGNPFEELVTELALHKVAAAEMASRKGTMAELDKLAEERAEELLYAHQAGIPVTFEKAAAAAADEGPLGRLVTELAWHKLEEAGLA